MIKPYTAAIKTYAMTFPIKRFNVSTNSFIDCLLFTDKCYWRQQDHRQLVDGLFQFLHALFMVFKVALFFFLITLFTLVIVDDGLNHRNCASKAHESETADKDVYKNCANHDCLHSLSPPLIKEIIVIISCKVGFCRCFAAKRLTVTEFLQIVKSTGNPLISRAVKSIETDAGTTIYSGIDLGTSKDRIAVCIYDARRRSRICVNEICIRISLVVRSFKVAITKRCFKYSEGRDRLAVSFEFCFSLMVGCFNGRLNLGDGFRIGLRNNQTDTVLRCAAVDGFWLPDVGVAPTSVRTSDNFHGICHFYILIHCHIPP
uniref:Uncharacterized protein n=1 Tax=Siphoviridae sp. ctSOv1 TaxID=2827872 RepID=A0A8S5T0K0_9CAUD|nr:MAG TPA: hypothetical protein [Siphoviridae sp. ctSOv1]